MKKYKIVLTLEVDDDYYDHPTSWCWDDLIDVNEHCQVKDVKNIPEEDLMFLLLEDDNGW